MDWFVLLSTHAAPHADVSFIDKLLGSNVFNVGLVALGLGFLLGKLNIGKKLNASSQKTASTFDEAETLKSDAAARLRDLRSKTDNLDKDVEKILAAAKASAERTAAQIVDSAQAEAARLKANAEKQVSQEEKRRIQELELSLLKRAVDSAKAQLSSAWNESEQIELTSAMIDKLPELVKPSGGKS